MKCLRWSMLPCAVAGLFSAPKPPLDESAYLSWPHIGQAVLSNDGRYAAFHVFRMSFRDGDARASSVSDTTWLASTDSSWKEEVKGGVEGQFSDNGAYYIYLTRAHALEIQQCGTEQKEVIANVASFKISGRGKGEWLTYRMGAAQATGALILRRVRGGAERRFPNVGDYWLSPEGNSLAAVAYEGKSREGGKLWLLPTESLSPPVAVWKGEGITRPMFSEDGGEFAFVGLEGKTQSQSGLWWYAMGDAEAKRLRLHTRDAALIGGPVASIKRFSADGRKLFVSLDPEAAAVKRVPGMAMVTVWRYSDWQISAMFPPQKMGEPVLAAVDRDGTLVELAKGYGVVDESNDRWVIVRKPMRDGPYQPRSAPFTEVAVSTADGHEREFERGSPKAAISGNDGVMSPSGKYVLFWNDRFGAYYSCDCESGVIHRLTEGKRDQWLVETQFYEDSEQRYTCGVAGWMRNGDEALIYDRYDIWRVDLSGSQQPICLTNKYGKTRGVRLRLMRNSNDPIPVLSSCAKPLVVGLNMNTYESGMFRMGMDIAADPHPLAMGPYWYGSGGGANVNYRVGYGFSEDEPIFMKARDVDVYLVAPGSVESFPNLSATKDWQTFFPITDFHPETKYNWLTSELVSWKGDNGEVLHGVLYKPEDFDPAKRYPAIIGYYGTPSYDCHAYRYPWYSGVLLNVPTFVSAGYIMLTPDIKYHVDHLAQSTVACVEAAAKWLSSQAWIDARHIGIQGHSWGGNQTNMIVTRSHLFAAAYSAEGVADDIMDYGADPDRAYSYAYRFSGTPWEMPQTYLANSPVMAADKVTTPLLVMANPLDFDCYRLGEIEFFSDLRQLKRKAWLLAYDNEAHGVDHRDNLRDANIRVRQFFDYYLKGAPPPRWMTEGIPGRFKGSKDGLELDYSGRVP